MDVKCKQWNMSKFFFYFWKWSKDEIFSSDHVSKVRVYNSMLSIQLWKSLNCNIIGKKNHWSSPVQDIKMQCIFNAKNSSTEIMQFSFLWRSISIVNIRMVHYWRNCWTICVQTLLKKKPNETQTKIPYNFCWVENAAWIFHWHSKNQYRPYHLLFFSTSSSH